MLIGEDTREASPAAERTRQVLNVGSGPPSSKSLHPGFRSARWKEIRLDIDPGTQPDIVGSLTDLGRFIGDASLDAIWCSHALEHLYTHEVIPALREFRRVLRPDGFALVTCPDLTAVARYMLENGVEAVAYQSAVGPIRALDMLFGHAKSISEGRRYMAHCTGFTAERLGRVASESGFAEARIFEGDDFDLWAALLTPGADIAQLRQQFAGSNVAGLFEMSA